MAWVFAVMIQGNGRGWSKGGIVPVLARSGDQNLPALEKGGIGMEGYSREFGDYSGERLCLALRSPADDHSLTGQEYGVVIRVICQINVLFAY